LGLAKKLKNDTGLTPLERLRDRADSNPADSNSAEQLRAWAGTIKSAKCKIKNALIQSKNVVSAQSWKCIKQWKSRREFKSFERLAKLFNQSSMHICFPSQIGISQIAPSVL
jgi:hypothetical protein